MAPSARSEIGTTSVALVHDGMISAQVNAAGVRMTAALMRPVGPVGYIASPGLRCAHALLLLQCACHYV